MKHTYKNIKFDLVKMEKALVFQILEQDESWINRKSNPIYNSKHFKAKNGMKITTFMCPEITENFIELRGYKSNLDLKPVSVYLWSNESRDEYQDTYIQALKEWDEMVEGLKKELLTKKENK